MTTSKVPGIFSYEIDARAEDNPTFEVITFENGAHADEILTYEKIVVNGCKLAKRLVENGFQRGDVLALVMRNHPEFVYALYATNALGAILLPIDPRTKGDRLEYVLKDSKAKGLIFTSEFMEPVSQVLNHLPGINVIGVVYKEDMNVPLSPDYHNLYETWQAAEVAPPEERCDDLTAPMEIIYTSGTTGDPKGVVLKNARIAPFGMLAQGVFQYKPEDKLYTGCDGF